MTVRFADFEGVAFNDADDLFDPDADNVATALGRCAGWGHDGQALFFDVEQDGDAHFMQHVVERLYEAGVPFFASCNVSPGTPEVNDRHLWVLLREEDSNGVLPLVVQAYGIAQTIMGGGR